MSVPTWLKRTMLVVDAGFIAYWLVVALSIVPASSMFEGYADPRVQAWNWSFLPLDIAASVTGFVALRRVRRRAASAVVMMSVSLTLTAVAGGMALAYWAVRAQFDWLWWLPNGLLLAFGVTGLVVVARHPLASGQGERATLVA